MALKKLIYAAFIWRGLNYISVFALNIITARILGAEVSGEVYYVITFFSLIILFASLNLESSLNYFSLSKEIHTNSLISISLTWVAFFSVVFFFSFKLFSSVSPPLFKQDFRAYSLLFVAGMLMSAYYTSLFYGQKKFALPNIVSLLANAAVFVFVITEASVNKNSSREYLLYYFVVSFVQGLVTAFFFHLIYTPKFSFSLPSTNQLRKIARYSALTFMTSIFLFLLYRIDYWLILRFNPSPFVEAELGNYIQVSKLIFSLQVFSSMLGAGIFSGTVSNNDIRNDKIPGLIIRTFFYIGIIGFLFLLFFGKQVFILLYGESFPLMYDCFLLILPGAILLMTVSITANYLSGLGKLKYNLLAVTLSLVLIIGMDAILIPMYGIYGAAAVSGISYFVYGLIMLFQFSKHYNGGWASILSFRNDPALFRSAFFKR